MLPIASFTQPPQIERVIFAQAAERAQGASAFRDGSGPRTILGPSAVSPLSSGIGPRGLERLVTSSQDSADPRDLTPEELETVQKLAARDREVRNHEAAHALVGGRYAGAPSFEYTTGPDGKRYAVSGSVQIDVAPVRGDPEATIAKMETVKAAALAPGEPSGADRQVAARAEALKREAIAELNAERLRAAFEGEAQPVAGAKVIPKDEPAFEPWFVSTIEEALPIIGPQPFGVDVPVLDMRK